MLTQNLYKIYLCQRSKPSHHLGLLHLCRSRRDRDVRARGPNLRGLYEVILQQRRVSNRPIGSRQYASGKQGTAQAAAGFHLHSPIASRRRNRQVGLTPGPAVCLRSRDGRGVPLSRAHRWDLKRRRDRELGTPAHLLVCYK